MTVKRWIIGVRFPAAAESSLPPRSDRPWGSLQYALEAPFGNKAACRRPRGSEGVCVCGQ